MTKRMLVLLAGVLVAWQMAAADEQPIQVQIDMEWVSVPLDVVADIRNRGERVTAGVLRDLAADGKARTVYMADALVRSGIESVVKAVTEYIYPTEYTVFPYVSTNRNERVTGIEPAVEPSSFETREVGVTMGAMPEVGPDGRKIHLTMTPQVVEAPEWQDYGFTTHGRDGKPVTLTMKQPFFRTHTLCTSVTLTPGTPLVLGGASDPKDPARVTYVRVTAYLFGSDGKPAKAPGEAGAK